MEYSYTDKELKEDFVSDMIARYKLHNNYHKIKRIHELADSMIELTNKHIDDIRYDIKHSDLDNMLPFIKNKDKFPDWMLPISKDKQSYIELDLGEILFKISEKVEKYEFVNEEPMVGRGNDQDEPVDFDEEQQMKARLILDMYPELAEGSGYGEGVDAQKTTYNYIQLINRLHRITTILTPTTKIDNTDTFSINKYNDAFKSNIDFLRNCNSKDAPCSSIHEFKYLFDIRKTNGAYIIPFIDAKYNPSSHKVIGNQDINIKGFCILPENYVKNVDLNDNLFNINEKSQIFRENQYRNAKRRDFYKAVNDDNIVYNNINDINQKNLGNFDPDKIYINYFELGEIIDIESFIGILKIITPTIETIYSYYNSDKSNKINQQLYTLWN